MVLRLLLCRHSRRPYAVAGLALFAALLPLAPAADDALERFEYFRLQMGTRVRIVLYAPTEVRAVEAARAAFERIAELDAALTDYNPESELSRLGREAHPNARAVGADLFAVLERAQQYAELSHGAFDVTIGPLVALWRHARRTGALPDAASLEAAHARTGSEKLVLDRAARTIRLGAAGMKLDVGGIAKGFAADEALSVLRRFGIAAALVAAGGDIAVGSAPPGRAGWTIGIQDPGLPPGEAPADLTLARCGISTSGDAEQYVEIGGRRYSHIVDPRTGLGLERSMSVTVLAPDAAASDALATALSVLEPRDAIELADRLEGIAAWIVERTAAGPKLHRSRAAASLCGASPHAPARRSAGPARCRAFVDARCARWRGARVRARNFTSFGCRVAESS